MKRPLSIIEPLEVLVDVLEVLDALEPEVLDALELELLAPLELPEPPLDALEPPADDALLADGLDALVQLASVTKASSEGVNDLSANMPRA